MGLQTIEYVATFDLQGQHTFAFKRLGGWVFDTLEVTIDDQLLLTTQMGPWKHRTYRHHCSVDQHPVEIVWRWNIWGDPLYIALRDGPRLLAIYGNLKALTTAESMVNTAGQPEPRNIAAVSLVHDDIDRVFSEQIAQEDFPLDNSSGSDVLSVEHEISRSVNSSLDITNRQQIESYLKGTLATVVESQLAAHLSRETSHTIGETTTRRQQVRFSVKPGEAVVYTVTWRIKVRTGACHFSIDGNGVRIPYEVRYGLSFEVDSRPLIAQLAGEDSNAVRNSSGRLA